MGFGRMAGLVDGFPRSDVLPFPARGNFGGLLIVTPTQRVGLSGQVGFWFTKHEEGAAESAVGFYMSVESSPHRSWLELIGGSQVTADLDLSTQKYVLCLLWALMVSSRELSG